MHNANIKINLINASRINRKFPTHAQVFGKFICNCTLLALLGHKCIAPTKPLAICTGSVYGIEACHIAPDLMYYRHYEVHRNKILAKLISHAVMFLHYKL